MPPSLVKLPTRAESEQDRSFHLLSSSINIISSAKATIGLKINNQWTEAEVASPCYSRTEVAVFPPPVVNSLKVKKVDVEVWNSAKHGMLQEDHIDLV